MIFILFCRTSVYDTKYTLIYNATQSAMQDFLETGIIQEIFGYMPKANRIWLPLARGACKVYGILNSRRWRRQCAYNVLAIQD